MTFAVLSSQRFKHNISEGNCIKVSHHLFSRHPTGVLSGQTSTDSIFRFVKITLEILQKDRIYGNCFNFFLENVSKIKTIFYNRRLKYSNRFLNAGPERVWVILKNEMGTDENYRRMDYRGEDIPGNTHNQEALYVRENTTIENPIYNQVPVLGVILTADALTEMGSHGAEYDVGDLIIFRNGINNYLEYIKTSTENSLRANVPGITGTQLATWCYTPNATDRNKLTKYTIAHEIGHGLDLVHDTDTTGDCVMERGARVTISPGSNNSYRSELKIGSTYDSHHNSEYNLK